MIRRIISCRPALSPPRTGLTFASWSARDERADALVGEELGDEAVRYAAVDDMHMLHPCRQRPLDGARPRLHIAGEGPRGQVCLQLWQLHLREQLVAPHETRSILQVDELVGL